MIRFHNCTGDCNNQCYSYKKYGVGCIYFKYVEISKALHARTVSIMMQNLVKTHTFTPKKINMWSSIFFFFISI